MGHHGFLRTIRLLFLFVIGVGVQAQEFAVLVPVGATSGANGSSWVIEHYGRGFAGEELCFTGPVDPVPCQPSGVTFWLTPDSRAPEILRLRGNRERVQFSLRVRDAAHAASSAGAEVPVVPLEDFATDTIELLDVPLEPTSRRNLRIYADDELTTPVTLRVRVWDHRRDVHDGASLPTAPVLLSEHDFTLAPDDWWVSIANFDDVFASTAATDRLRVQIERVSGDARFWAFVTVTNNATHHVTTVTPFR